jgi:hypothetical protein
VSFILVAVLLAVGLVILALGLLGLAGHTRRLAAARAQVKGEIDEATGMLRARKAALRIAIRDRRAAKEVDMAKKVNDTVTKV